MKRTIILSLGLLLILGGAWVVAQEDLPPAKTRASVADQYSYAIGLDMGKSFRESETTLSVEQLAAGLRDGLSGAKPKFDKKACDSALQELQTLMSKKAMSRQQRQSERNKKMGAEFLAKNAKAEGVKVTKSGLQYKVIQAGNGPTPRITDTVKCNYKGTLIDGTVFDASERYGGPAEFPVNRVIPGWTEALQMMKVGDKWQLFIPAELAYGDNPPGPPIEAGSTLIFDIELLGISGQ